MISAGEILDIVEIIYFVPILPLTVYVCSKHGFKREGGWLLLTILSLIRIVGAALGIAAEKNPAQGLIEASLVLSSIGSATLVAAFTGITNRIADGAKGSPFTPKQRKLLQLIGIVSIVMGIIGGTKLGDSDPDTRSTGQTYLKVAVVLILIQFLATSLILAYAAWHIRQVMEGDRKLFFCVAFAVPFLFVRVLYSLLAAFDTSSTTFSLLSDTTTAIVVRACLGIAMEIIVVTLFTTGGIISPKLAKGHRSVEDDAFTHGSQPPKEHYLNQNVQYHGVATRSDY